jgi:hypothetical protein
MQLNAGQRGHLMGDVPALLGAAVLLVVLTPRGDGARAATRTVA